MFSPVTYTHKNLSHLKWIRFCIPRLVCDITVIVFPHDKAPCVWCITSQAPPIPRERERESSPSLTPLPHPLYWSYCVFLSPWLQIIFYLSSRSFIPSGTAESFFLPLFTSLFRVPRSRMRRAILPLHQYASMG